MANEIKPPNNAEIDAALKEFERQSNPALTQTQTLTQKAPDPLAVSQPPIKKIEGVQFEEPSINSMYINKLTKEKKTSLASWLVNIGVAKDERFANLILIGVVVILVVCSGLIFSKSFSNQANPPTEAQKKSAEIYKPHSPI